MSLVCQSRVSPPQVHKIQSPQLEEFRCARSTWTRSSSTCKTPSSTCKTSSSTCTTTSTKSKVKPVATQCHGALGSIRRCGKRLCRYSHSLHSFPPLYHQTLNKYNLEMKLYCECQESTRIPCKNPLVTV